MIDYRVYLVTDEPSRYAGNWLDAVCAAVDGGVTCVQYRDTQSPARVAFARLAALKDVLAPRAVPLVVNNDVALALAVGADGIHVGQSDLPPDVVRRLVGPRVEVGLSITDLAQVPDALRARARGEIDCVGVGPVFNATRTKPDAAPEMGVAGLKEILEELGDLPAVAIGGITPARAPALVRAGVNGLAVVSALSQVPDPAAAARSFRQLFA